MPRPSRRTRSKKRVYKSLPGNGQGIHYKLKATAPRHCKLCGQPLAGFQHMSTSAARKLDKSEKTISRPYGGQICHNCLKTNLQQAARNI